MTGDIVSHAGFPLWVGFDKFFKDLEEFWDFPKSSSSTYPPYNIVKKDNKTFVEVAVAGIPKKDIKIILKDGMLNIQHETKKEEVKEENGKVLYRGIAQRAFNLSFKVSDDVIVNGANLEDGLLKIELEEPELEEKKPKLIEIK